MDSTTATLIVISHDYQNFKPFKILLKHTKKNISSGVNKTYKNAKTAEKGKEAIELIREILEHC